MRLDSPVPVVPDPITGNRTHIVRYIRPNEKSIKVTIIVNNGTIIKITKEEY